eukprot:8294913-Pyramimonas_sp.AAC.1
MSDCAEGRPQGRSEAEGGQDRADHPRERRGHGGGGDGLGGAVRISCRDAGERGDDVSGEGPLSRWQL